MKVVNVGLIGYGLSGSIFHAPFLLSHPGFQICKVSTSRTEAVKADLGEHVKLTTAADLVNDPAIELVINTAPNEVHYQLTKDALTLGKHVVVEKPFVLSSAEGVELDALAKRKNRVLSVFHNRRWDSDFLTIRKILAEGTLGQLYYFASSFHRFRPVVQSRRWRESKQWGSGTLFDLGSHLIDQVLLLFGPPVKIFADILQQRPNAVADDYFHLVLDYGKMRAILHASSLFLAKEPRFVLHGDRGSMVKFGLDGQEEALKKGLPPHAPTFGIEDPEIAAQLVCDLGASQTVCKVPSERGQYMSFFAGLYHALTQNSPPPVRAEEAIDTVRLIEKAYLSHDKRGWVAWEDEISSN